MPQVWMAMGPAFYWPSINAWPSFSLSTYSYDWLSTNHFIEVDYLQISCFSNVSHEIIFYLFFWWSLKKHHTRDNVFIRIKIGKLLYLVHRWYRIHNLSNLHRHLHIYIYILYLHFISYLHIYTYILFICILDGLKSYLKPLS